MRWLSACSTRFKNARSTQRAGHLNQMIQEQCRTRCGTGGGRFADAVTAESMLLDAAAKSGAEEVRAMGWGASEMGCSLPTAARSVGRMLQLQVRDCKRAQLSGVAEALERCAAGWQQARNACESKAAMGHDAALVTCVSQQRQ